MKILIITFLIFFFFGYSKGYGQLSTKEPPISFDLKKNLSDIEDDSIQIVTMPALDMKKIEAEDLEDEEYDMPPRFGFPHKVNYNLTNSGTWTELPNGDRLWRLNVICPNALSVNFCFDRFWIPKGGKLFVYSKDRRHYIGAFTSNNNKGDVNHIRGFATGLVYGNDVVLEYYQPKEVTVDAIISIEYVVHGYRYIKIGNKSLNDSGDCMVNVNCEEGQDWQNEKKAVALILVNGNRYCSGSLINTTDLSGKPYLLTANHCLRYSISPREIIIHDAETNPILDTYSFYWNYETPGCTNIYVEPTHYSTNSATVLANNSTSDFALLRLAEDPKDIIDYTPYYLGWDCSGQSDSSGVCIHHPAGDVKKISTIASQPISTDYFENDYDSEGDHWRVTWCSTQNGYGTTEGGSSGSPLLTSGHKVIGQLHGGYADCDENIGEPDWFGKFSVSWSNYNVNSIYRRLNYWLDSLNIGVLSMEGLQIVSSIQLMTTSQHYYGNIRITNGGQLHIQGNVQFMGNSCLVVENGAKLVIDSGTVSDVNLVMKSGSTLQIINGGTLKTNNGFDAPAGVVVDVIHGQILE